MFIKLGEWMEHVIKHILQFWLKKPIDVFKPNTQELIDNLRINNPERYKLVTNFLGKESRWSLKSSDWILDKAYKLDVVIEASPGVFFGFDLTTNKEKLDEKVEEITSLIPSYLAIGITKVCVLLLKVDENSADWSLVYSNNRAEVIEEDLWNIIYSIDESETFVFSTFLDTTH